jgi:hypothetical protein
MIDKPSIIVTSLGRTGTKFFQLLFEELITDGTSLHEPDYFNFGQYRGAGERIRQAIRQMREAGVSNLVVRKSLGHWSLVELSDARVRGELGYAEAVRRVLDQRREFVRSRSGSVYVESSSAYYGLIDVLKDVYRQHRVVYLVRDGRDWVQSKMNWGRMYAKGGIGGLLSHTWPTALDVADDPYQSRWGSMSRFDRLCWAWVRLNEYALAAIQENPNARLFHFEGLFRSEDRYRYLEDLVRFSTTFPRAEPIAVGPFDGWLERQVHQSEARFPPWEGWSAEHRQQFEAICGPLMRDLGYELD